ncbi:MAG: hypothetical protein AAFP86_20835 [Planctomycetota bacterium]
MNSTRSTSNHPAAQGPGPSHRGLRRTVWAILLVYGTFLAGALVTGAPWTSARRAEFLDVTLIGPVMPVYYGWLYGAAALGGGTSGALMKGLGIAAIAAGHLGLVGLGRLCAGARPPARYVLAAFLASFVLAEGGLRGCRDPNDAREADRAGRRCRGAGPRAAREASGAPRERAR